MPEPENNPGDALVELPLFPLNLVLFPGAPLPLHIFEERYKAMIGDCLTRNVPFGVVLIREGPEVGGPAEPHLTGTTARVLRSELLEEGRMNIMTKGERRFRVEEIIQQTPHVVARVRFLDESEGEGVSEIMPEIAAEYSALVRNLTALSGGYTSNVAIPEDPVVLSYSIAANLELPSRTRQDLLEAETAEERLRKLAPLLKLGNQALEEEVAKRNPYKGPRLN